MKIFANIDDLRHERANSGRPYLEFLRVPAMSCGLYVLAAGAEDKQQPHREDEVYYVVAGSARMKVHAEGQEEDRKVNAGDIIFVRAGEEHRFHSITSELTVLVFFAPAES